MVGFKPTWPRVLATVATPSLETGQPSSDSATPADAPWRPPRSVYRISWRYGLLHRPLANYFNLSFPDPILHSDRPSSEFPYYGTAEWPCEIPEEEARHHSLVLVSAPRIEEEWGEDNATQQLERGPR